jgi:DNA mismatch repair protein MutL
MAGAFRKAMPLACREALMYSSGMPNSAQIQPVRLLSEEVANQIAAGEVVERPASVLKELVENSLDAGAKKISVEVEAGGHRLIRVVDDGIGLSQDDLLMALERHATSKVSSSDDLAAVTTLGFRGEAIPSIAVVSRFTMRSRRKQDEVGSEVIVRGGSLREVKEVGCPIGTVVEVRDLFFNTPARRKFLKSVSTESGHLGEAMLRQALAMPEVAFKYTVNGRLIYDLPASADLSVRVAALLGKEAATRMVKVKDQAGGLEVSGLAGLPDLSRAAMDQIYTFINGRYVRDKVLLHAVNQAYRGLMPNHRKPVVVLRLEVDPAEVDVNVHPAKIEVRFHRQKQLHDNLAGMLRQALADSSPLRADVGPSDPVIRPQPEPAYKPASKIAQRPAPFPARQPVRPALPTATTPGGGMVLHEPAAEKREEEVAPHILPHARPLFGPAGDLTVLGQLHGLYIICASEQGLVIVDQHAAHERLTYEVMKNNLGSGDLPRQGLLSPTTLELTPKESSLAQSQCADWARLGLEMGPFGGNTWVVMSVPPILAGQDPTPIVRDLLAELSKAGIPSGTPEFLEVALRSLACRASIKSGKRLVDRELQDLVARAAALPPPVTCPHGRPVFLKISRRELAKHFKRSAEPAF